jgi:hypothetical protein
VCAIATPAFGSEIVVSLSDYNGPTNTSGFPINLGTIGTFSYAPLTGSTITAAYLEGTYGTQAFGSSTASFDAGIDGAGTVTVCAMFASTCFSTGADLRPFSIALPSSFFSYLMDGSASLNIIQTTQSNVRYGTPTLRIETTTGAVPEPTTWALLLMGFGGIGLAMRRQRAIAAPMQLA